MTVVGTRPEIIRLSCVLQKLDASEAIEHTLVHTGQNYDYELNEVFFEDLGLRKPDHFLNAAGKTATETAGLILVAIEPVLEQVKPDAFLVLGDTNSCLCAIAAKKRHIPIFHMEAGNRCFDQRVPEESNRKIVDHIADINLTYSDIAREYLLAEGLRPDRIIKTGSPMFEVLSNYHSKIAGSKILDNLHLTIGEYFVVSAHREENIASEKNFFNLVAILNQVAEHYQLPVIVSTHPRTRKMLERKGIIPTEEAGEKMDATAGALTATQAPASSSSDTEESQLKLSPFVKLMKPMGLSDYIALQMNSKAVLSDSGTISEESSILNFRALNIREAHERPEAMEEASVMMVGMNPERVMQGLMQIEQQITGDRTSIEAAASSGASRFFRPVADYSMPNVSDKVVRIIISYTDYVKRVVWSE